ncbi:UDP-3-O-acyl-N-acetylglucosamine deacetylase [Chitinophaga sedimenti]|uniref:UDP-3-O-acyl-N-acetylglucosamine deacetylase n=1 Tax=Chitinophaga sedimenti TaxID=2033606 RepID=UPI00249EB77F|nr:UDP-3-O-acyl-N-acetylglucosamine deacetylase [Chitinophaga sedimenti]
MTEEELDRLAKIFNRDKMSVQREGILNNISLRFPNEPARHKLLDVVGDLALIGYPIKAHIIANRPGHASNVEFAKKIKAYIKRINTRRMFPSTIRTSLPCLTSTALRAPCPTVTRS